MSEDKKDKILDSAEELMCGMNDPNREITVNMTA